MRLRVERRSSRTNKSPPEQNKNNKAGPVDIKKVLYNKIRCSKTKEGPPDIKKVFFNKIRGFTTEEGYLKKKGPSEQNKNNKDLLYYK